MLTHRSVSLSVAEKGFVFVTILIILSVLTVLVVSNMRWVSLDWKRYADMQQFQEHVISLEHMAEGLGHRLSEHPLKSCVIDCQTDNKLLIVSVKKHGCRISQHYRYLLNDLGGYPCVKLTPKLSTHHWLLTVIDEQLPQKVLQLRIASSEPAQPCPESRVVLGVGGILTRHWVFQ